MSLHIRFDNPQEAYGPGDEITGRISWEFTQSPGDLTAALYFTSKGKSTPQRELVDVKKWENCMAASHHSFRFTAGDWPWSFSGKLISLEWGIHAEFSNVDDESETTIVISPSGSEIDLHVYPKDDLGKQPFWWKSQRYR